MGLPGGINPAQALEAAQVNVESYRETALALLDRAIADLGADATAAPSQEIARLADSIAGLAGTFDLDALSHVARRLCDTVRLQVATGQWEQTTVDIHIAALRIVRARADADNIPKLLEGLDRLAARTRRA
jgi:HPt (histidine-containing phosphotransfer) domain-containing protein